MGEFLSIVRFGRTKRVVEEEPGRRLTSVERQQAIPPESGELDLTTVEGKLVRVGGVPDGGWVYGARILSAQFFRANVGMVLINTAGSVLKVERKKKGSGVWQMPQGGLDEFEEPRAAAERELREELGLNPQHVELLREHPEWLAYELPAAARKTEPGEDAKHGRGQVQKWFLYRFVGQERDINLSWALEHGGKQEFYAWDWTKLRELAEETWEVRRPVYRTLAGDFTEFLSE